MSVSFCFCSHVKKRATVWCVCRPILEIITDFFSNLDCSWACKFFNIGAKSWRDAAFSSGTKYSVSHIEILDSVDYYFQYLTHESSDAINKNKHKYDKKDIRYINDFDIDRYVTLDESQKRELKNQLLQIIRKKHLVNVLHLLDFLEKNGSEYGITNLNDVNDVVTSNASGFRLYFDANYQDGFRRERKINRETGEIISGVDEL